LWSRAYDRDVIQVRRAEERGRSNFGWLDSRHTFSFGEYYDDDHMGFRALRVINDDRVSPAAGFGTHGHRDMEILSYVLEGGLAHKDSMGNGSVLRPGAIQMMRAGTGVTHSEYNHSSTEPVHFLQIWIVPDQRGLRPAYAETVIDAGAAAAGRVLLASNDGRDGSMQIQQDVDLWLLRPPAGAERVVPLREGRHAWVHVAQGSLTLDGEPLAEGDGAAVTGARELRLVGGEGAEVLVFDLA
jgi:redox-sensitive bicupin YhaK (pirin superfamily)